MIQLLRRTGRPIGVAVVTLLLVAGGALAGNAILGGGRSDGTSGLSTGLSSSETRDPSEAPAGTDAAETVVPEPTDSPEATEAPEATRAPEATEAAGDEQGLASSEPGAEQGANDQLQSAEPSEDHLVAGTPEPVESSADGGGGGTSGGDAGSSPGHD